MTPDDQTQAAATAPPAHPVRLVITDDLVRSRLTVLFRLLLVIPLLIWLGLWSIAAFFLAFVNWLVTFVAGRSPKWLHRMLSSYVKYTTHVFAYQWLAANRYPNADGRPGYPIDVEIDGPERQRRLTVLARVLVAIPAAMIASSLFGLPTYRSNGSNWTVNVGGVGHAAAIFGWFACLATARMPRGLRDTVAWGLGYSAQFWAYLLILTDAYPNCDPDIIGELPDRGGDPIALTVRDEERRSRLTTFFRLPLAFPHFAWMALWTMLVVPAVLANWIATLVTGRPPAGLHRFLASYLRYQTHFWSFFTLIGNPFPGFAGTAASYPVEADIQPPGRQNRWGVLFRLVLVFPAWVIAAGFGTLLALAAVFGWFAALVFGRMPRQLRHAGAQAMRCIVQTYGYLFVVHGAYPYLGPCRIPGFASAAPVAPSPGLPQADADASAAFG